MDFERVTLSHNRDFGQSVLVRRTTQYLDINQLAPYSFTWTDDTRRHCLLQINKEEDPQTDSNLP